MKPWWNHWPHIYQREIDALNDVGISFAVYEKAKQQGRIVLELTVVTHAVGPGPKAVHKRYFFLPDVVWPQSKMARIYRD